MSNRKSVNGDYLNGMSEKEIVIHHTYCDALLTLAQWLDSQEDSHLLFESPVEMALLNLSVSWSIMSFHFGGSYYHSLTTNKERVLAVLFLREVLLDQGAL